MKATKQELEFLKQSNWIEREFSPEALEDAVSAWEYAKGLEVITFDDVMKIHFLMQQRLRPDIAGKLRDCDVYIGGHRKIFVSQALLKEDLMSVLEEPLNPVGSAKIRHIKFENAHIFEDGNGRVGRILYNWELLKTGNKIHIIKADWPDQNGDQANYYKWFKQK